MTARKWKFERDGHVYNPEVLEVGMKGRHYDALIHDDMIDATIYAMKSTFKDDRFMRQGIITNITEGGNEMDRRLYHVILFNKKTENIDFKEYVAAKDETDASMQAAQAYGKYSSVVHVTIVKYIEGSDYEVIK